MSGSDAVTQDGSATISGEAPANASAIAKLQSVVGPVTISRADLIIAGGAGDLVHQGDVVETGDNALATIAFADGSTLHLYANGRVELDEVVTGTAKSASALLRVAKGVFGFIGGKLAAADRLSLDTPLGQLRNRTPGFGIGTVALGVFTFAFVPELRADSADVALLDNGLIDYKDLKHGVFEIITKGEHPQRIIVDDPTQTVVLRARGSSITVTEVANSPAQMAQLQSAYSNAYSTYTQGLQDPFIQQWQHANAQPQSNPGGNGGSGTDPVLLAFNGGSSQGNNPVVPNINIGGGGGPNNTGSSTGGTTIITTVPEPGSLSWSQGGTTASNPGFWNTTIGWGDPPWLPDSAHMTSITIGIPAFVIINTSSGNLNGAPTSANILIIDGGATLEIMNNALMTVSNNLKLLFGTVEVFDAGSTLDLTGAVTVKAPGTLEAVAHNAVINISDTTGNFAPDSMGNPTIYTVDNQGKILADNQNDSAALGPAAEVVFQQAVVHNEAAALVIAQNGGTIIFHGPIGSTSTSGFLQNDGVVLAEGGGSVLFDQGMQIDNTGTVSAGDATGSGLDSLTDSASDVEAGGAITFDASNLTNESTGVIEAQNSGLVTIQTGNTVINLGTLDAATGGAIALYDNVNNSGGLSLIQLEAGGTLAIDANLTITGGVIRTLGAATPFGAGELAIADGVALTLTNLVNNEINNAGAIVLNPTGNPDPSKSTYLYFDEAISTLAGTGTVTLLGDAHIDLAPAFVGTATLSNENTVTGEGEIGGGFSTLTNTGTIEATPGVLTSTLTLDPGSLTNTGTVGADGIGAKLVMSGEVVTNSGGIVQADNGGQVALSGTDSISDGQLIVESGGQLAITTAASVTLDHVTVDDDTTATGSLAGIDVASGAVLTLDNGTQIRGGGSPDNPLGPGTLTVEVGGQLAITTASGATLDGLLVTDNSTTDGIDVGPSAILTLTDGATISGGTLTIENAGEILITAGAGLDGADPAGTNTISHVTVTDVGTTSIVVSGGTLTLDHVSISGGLITIEIDPGATLNVLDHSFIANAKIENLGGTLNVSDSTIQTVQSGLSGHNTVLPGSTLTLIDETVTGTIDDQGRILVTTQFPNAVTFPNGAIFDGVTVDDDTIATATVTPGIDVASGATLTLKNNTQIQGGGVGTLTIESGGQLAITTPTGATLDGVVVSDNNTVDGIDVGPNAVLTLNDGTAISGGTLTVESTGELLITAGSGGEDTSVDISEPPGLLADTPSGRGATLDGVIVTDNSGFLATDVGGIQVSGAVLTLKDGTQIKGGGVGALVIEGSGAQLSIGSGGATLDGMVVTDDNANGGGTLPGIDVASGAVLTLNDATQIISSDSGTLTVESGGKLSVTAGAGAASDGASSGGATLDGVVVTDSSTLGTGGIEVASGAVLTLKDGTQIVSTDSGTLQIDSGGQVAIAAGGATLDGVLVNASGAVLSVHDGDTLTLSGVTISGGTINDGDQANTGTPSGATIAVTGNSTISGAALNDGLVTVASGVTLTLDNDVVTGTTFTDAPGTLKVDDGATLTLSGVTISSLTIDDGTLANTGTPSGAIIHVTGSSTVNSNAVLNDGVVNVDAATTLTFGNATVTGTTFNDPGTIRVASGRTLTLSGTDIITGSQFAFSGFFAKAGVGTVALKGLSVGSLVSTNDNLTLTIQTTNGTLQSSGATSGNNTSQLTFSGTLSAINLALENQITYSSLGTATQLTVTVVDDSTPSLTATRIFSLDSTGTVIQTTDATGAIRNGDQIDIISGTTTLQSDVLFNGTSKVTVESGAHLILNHTAVFGTHTGHGITATGGTIIDDQSIEIAGRSGINGLIVDIASNAILMVDGGVRLDLNGDTINGINGGLIQDYNIAGGGNIDITGITEIVGAGIGAASVQLTGNNLNSIVTLDATLTLDFVKLSGITIATDAALLTPQTLTLADTVEVAGPTTFENLVVTNTGATLQVDNAVTLTVNGTTIHGGTLVLGSGGGGSGPSITEISVPDSGGKHFNAIGPEISADGKFVAFIASTGLPGGQDNHLGTAAIELYNVATHALADISAGAAALLPAGATNVSFDGLPSLSADGGLVVFQGHFLVSGNDQSDVFLYNTQSQQVSLVPNASGQAVISGNGQYIASEGNADQVFGTHVLVMNDSGTVQTEIAGDPSYVPPQNGPAPNINPASVFNPAISSDGQFVSFWSTSATIVVSEGSTYTFHTGNTAETAAEVYVYDTVNHTLQEISAVNPGTIANNNTFSGTPGDGNSGTLSTTDQNNNNWASSLSADGRFVVFQSTADNLVNNVGGNGVSNIFVYDAQTGKIVALTDANGTAVSGSSIRPQISADGAHVTFASTESDLAGANGGQQTYIVSINAATDTAGTPQLLSTGFAGTDNGQNDLGNAVSNGGTVAAFGGAVLALNFTQGGQALVSPGTVKFSGGGITAYNAASDTLTVTVHVGDGTLTPVSGAGLTIIGGNDGSNGTLEFTGSLDAINANFQSGVTYKNSDSATSDTITLTITDGHGDTATSTTQFNPQTANSTGGSQTGQYDIFLVDQNGTGSGGTGIVDVTGNSKIDNNAVVDGGEIKVENGVILTLDYVTLNGTTVDAVPGATLSLFHTITDNGAIIIDSAVPAGADMVINNTVTLNGTGTVTLDGSTDEITGASGGGTLDNFITIAGQGQIGLGNEALVLNNELGGIIDANVNGGTLTIATGTNTLVNAGTYEATNGGELDVHSTVNDAGGAVQTAGGFVDFFGAITGGSATISGSGKLEFGGSSDLPTAFVGSGTLVLDHQKQSDPNFGTAHYSGTISGFGSGDGVVLSDLAFSATATDVWNGVNHTLTVNSAGDTATISLAGTYQQYNFALEQNGAGTEVVFSPTQVTLENLTNGNAVQDQQITVLLSDPNQQSVSYTWIVGGQVVSGDSTATYTPTEGDEGKTLVVLTNFLDTSTSQIEHVTSLAGTIQESPTENATMTASGLSSGTTGNAVQDQTVTATVTESDAPASGILYSFQTSSDGGAHWTTVQSGTDVNSYKPLETDEGKLLQVVTSFTDSHGFAETGTLALGTVQEPSGGDLATTLSSTTPQQGTAITVTQVHDGVTTVTSGLSYQWLSNGSPATGTGATTATYTPDAADVGSNLSVKVTYTNASESGGSEHVTSTAGTVTGAPPTGFNFTVDTATLGALQSSGSGNGLDDGVQITTFTEAGGIAGDTYTFTIGGTGSNFTTNAGTNSETLFTGNSDVLGSSNGTVYALTVQVNDTTNSTHSAAIPFDLVVGNSSNNTINLESGSGNLGISATTATIVYGLAGNDTIDATGMTAPVWFVGGSGKDTMTGGSGQNTYLYASQSESSPSGPDTITNFHAATDVINLSAISGITTVQGLITGSTSINAHSIAWIQNGTETDIYVNPTNSNHSQGNSNELKIVLANFTAANLDLNHTDFILSNGSAGPAGVAGRPINLALSNPPAANGGPVTVTVSGLPSGSTLNEGTNLGNGSWSVQTSDLTSLTVLTAFVGAMVLSVTETWANAEGSTGTATVADNVEAYAPHSPIFALANDDTLSGAGGNDLFVFAQPIGNDTIHNFNVASDQINLMGFANVASISDLQIADDANGNAVVTVGPGETITVQGVDAASLTASNFEFNQTPTLNNSGTMMINDGAVLPLSGIVNNSGVIELNSTGDLTEIVIIGSGATLEGHGQVIMSDSPENFIIGSDPNAILTNVDNTISGVGQIGTGDGNLALVNDAAGTINANIAGGVLTLDTGNAINNYGVLEATNGGTLVVQDAVIGSGSAVIAGGTMQFDAASSVAVTFDNGVGGTSYGMLVLIDPSHFTGDISGFIGTAPDTAHSDAIDVVGINFNSGQFSDAYDGSTGVLTLSDGTNTDALQFVGFKGDINNFHFAEDANGTGTLVTDPPGLEKSATVSLISSDTTNNDIATQPSNLDSQQSAPQLDQNTSVAIGGPGGDHFVFAPDIGAETISNFNAQQDTIELDHFANAQTVQELQSLITTDAHGDALINLGHNDSINLTGTTATELQQLIQSGHVLLH